MGNKYKIPWAAWREPDYLELEFPDSWDVSLSITIQRNDILLLEEIPIKICKNLTP